MTSFGRSAGWVSRYSVATRSTMHERSGDRSAYGETSMPGSDATAIELGRIALAAEEEPDVGLELARGGIVGSHDHDELFARGELRGEPRRPAGRRAVRDDRAAIERSL